VTAPSARPLAAPGPASWGAALRHVALPFLLTRLLIVAAGVIALTWWGVDAAEAQRNFGGPSPPPDAPWLRMWVRYDAAWYLAIAQHGYTAPLTAAYEMRPGFFPLYPALLATLTPLVGDAVIAGVLLSNAATLALLLFAWRLVEADLGPDVATRAAWALMLWPTSVFLSGIYSEATMLACAAGGWWAARTGRWWLAGLGVALAALARPVGVLTALPVVLLALEWPHPRLAVALRRILRVGLPVAAALAIYLWLAAAWFGDPWAFVERQSLYRMESTWPWQAFVVWWRQGPQWHGYANSTLDAGLALLSLAACAITWARWRWEFGVYCVAAVLVPLSSGLVSFSRLSLAAFPLAAGVALLARRRALAWPLALLSLTLLLLLTARFATWRWAG
jgi:hypothetical protein